MSFPWNEWGEAVGGLPLDEIFLLCLLAVLAGAETTTNIAPFGRKKLDLLRRFRGSAVGTPVHDRLGDILAALDHEQFQRCFVAWISSPIFRPLSTTTTAFNSGQS